jgi:oligoendopeptidase F
MSQETIPSRGEIAKEDTWDLSKLFINDKAWETGLGEFEKLADKIPSFKGTLGTSAENLAAWLDFARDQDILAERLGYYAELRQTEDEGDNAARTMTGKFTMAASKALAASAWTAPEIMAISDEAMERFLTHPRLEEYRVYLKKLLRYKPYILSEKEERIIALHAEGEEISNDAFSVLTNVDIDFGVIETPEGKRPLSQSTLSVFMENPDRELRRRVYEQFYRQFDAHKNTLASLYAGQVKLNVIHARIRGHSSVRAAALFSDNVDEKVYDNLVDTVGRNLAPLHRYYSLRKKALKLPELKHYDVYAPLAAGAAKKTTWNEAVDIVTEALSPLGDEYTGTLRKGLLGRWADRYENKGKRSGAFSAGSYSGDPYILMNYKDDSIRDIFTLAHEGGHSMHSYYSAKNNPFMHYGYSIFEAEVASTFNEELLFRYLLAGADSNRSLLDRGSSENPEKLKLYLVNKRVDEILATLYRQTMFAEFEKRTHELEEGGTPLTVDLLREEYRKLQEKYFGSEMVLEKESDLEGLRIPHFYRAFYVYKYATGISASLALAERVLSGGKKEREDYFGFLKSGGSRFPIESLEAAGVNMASPAPVEAACTAFSRMVDELEGLL